MITHDRTPRSIVTVCRECGAREVHITPGDARAWDIDHLTRVHPEATAERTRSITASRVARYRSK